MFKFHWTDGDSVYKYLGVLAPYSLTSIIIIERSHTIKTLWTGRMPWTIPLVILIVLKVFFIKYYWPETYSYGDPGARQLLLKRCVCIGCPQRRGNKTTWEINKKFLDLVPIYLILLFYGTTCISYNYWIWRIKYLDS